MSRPLARARRIAKWTGVVLTAITLIAYPVSVRWGIEVARDRQGYVCLSAGQFAIVLTHLQGPSGLSLHRNDLSTWWGFHLQLESGLISWVSIPLWSLALAAAIPTALLWRADRRAKRIGGCVRCAYDLTGLPAHGGAAVCPECGQASPTRTTPPEPG